ncbi:hypothetical protein F5Y04DRAFT_275017 [Hypomontagnella monticulosa]|nr:hypothetical protein F5Y04DRAFT_275017 [Hypomontagnella monticulosa]
MSSHDELFSPQGEDYEPFSAANSPASGPSSSNINNVEPEDIDATDGRALADSGDVGVTDGRAIALAPGGSEDSVMEDSLEEPNPQEQQQEKEQEPEQAQEQQQQEEQKQEPEPEPELQPEPEPEPETQQEEQTKQATSTKRKIDDISTGDGNDGEAEEPGVPEKKAKLESSINVVSEPQPSEEQPPAPVPTPVPAPAPALTVDTNPPAPASPEAHVRTPTPEPYSPWRSTPISRLSLMDLLSTSGTTLNFLINVRGKAIDPSDASAVRSALNEKLDDVGDGGDVDWDTPARKAGKNAEAMVEKLLDMSVRDFVRLSHDVVSYKEDLDEQVVRKVF